MELALDQPRSMLGPLVAAAVSGDRDAFRRLVEPQLERALGAATIVTRSPEDAADAVQEAMLAAWQGLHRLRDADAFPAWFRTHVVRAAMRGSRRRGTVVELALEPAAPDGELDRALERRSLGRAFSRLDERDRLLLTLHHFWELPIAETASLLSIPEGTVKSRVHHAMERLRAACAAEERR
jgi:RNA polymerase sigma-70 factor (ECF subfamily)